MENLTLELVQMIDNGKIEDVKVVLGLDSKRSTQNKLIKAKHAFLKENNYSYETANNKSVLFNNNTKEIIYNY